MIYDYQDIATKNYITHMVKVWVKTGQNAMIILQNQKVREITEFDLSLASSDDVTWTVLYLIGVGLLRYIVNIPRKRFNIALNPHWEPPPWINAKISRARMNNHIQFMMEAEQQTSHDGVPLTPLIGSLEMITYHNWCKRAPKEPNLDFERERLIIRKNRQLHRAKLRFHSISG